MDNKNAKEKVRKLVGENIQKERIRRNLSIEELACLTGRTPGFISLIERGKRGATAELLTKLSEIFGISSDKLLHTDKGLESRVSGINPTKSVIKTKQAKIGSIIYGLNEAELDFIISIIKSLKRMHGSGKGIQQKSKITDTRERYT